MTQHKDWIRDAALEIVNEPYPDAYGEFEIKTIIQKHLPFKDGVAYMPVPRCDGCKYWDKDVSEADRGACLMMFEGGKTKIWPDYRDGINTTADFGCVQWEEKT